MNTYFSYIDIDNSLTEDEYNTNKIFKIIKDESEIVNSSSDIYIKNIKNSGKKLPDGFNTKFDKIKTTNPNIFTDEIEDLATKEIIRYYIRPV